MTKPDVPESGKSDEFYEAMPGTMERNQMYGRKLPEAPRQLSRNLLPWLLVPLALLLGWGIINSLNGNNGGNSGTGTSSSQAGQAVDQQSY
jgi:hypothetical protein